MTAESIKEPGTGQDTRRALRALAGLTDAEITQLAAQHVIACDKTGGASAASKPPRPHETTLAVQRLEQLWQRMTC